jgi:hypothetical protein
MPNRRTLVKLSAVLVLTCGCEPLLDLNHDYALRPNGTGGMSSTGADGGTTATIPGASGGITSPGLGGGSSSGGNTADVATGGSSAARTSAGGVATGGTSSALTSAGGVATGGATIGAGGVPTGGSSAARTSAGGAVTGGATSSGIGTGGAATGGTSSTRASTGGAATGGTSSTRVTTGGSTSGGASSGGTGTGGGSNCTACSHAITLQSESATPEHGSTSASGTTYSSYDDRCPNNQVLIGYAGTLRDDVHRVNDVPVIQLASLVAICGTVTLTATGTVTITPSSGLTPRGTEGPTGTFSQICPTDQVVVGSAGRSGTIIDQIGFVCASLGNSASGCCCSALSAGATYAFTPVGGTGGSAYSDSCPQGQVALGQSLYTATSTKHAGEEWVSRFGLLCGTPMPQVACGT